MSEQETNRVPNAFFWLIITSGSILHATTHMHTHFPYSDSLPFDDDEGKLLGKLKRKKVTVVGMGNVGLACVASILNQGICGSIPMIDQNKEKLEGEAKDFQHGAGFHKWMKILASTEYDVSADSDLVVVTAGAAQKPGESRLSLLERNVAILQSIIPRVLEQSPDAAIVIASNSCDIMAAVAAKIAGPSFPQGKIFGTGTNLDSSRFQTIIARSMGLDPNSIHGYIIGEHGDSSIPVWSSVRIGALPLLPSGEGPCDTLKAVHKSVVDAACDVINLKGYTNWAIGMSTANIASIEQSFRCLPAYGVCTGWKTMSFYRYPAFWREKEC